MERDYFFSTFEVDSELSIIVIRLSINISRFRIDLAPSKLISIKKKKKFGHFHAKFHFDFFGIKNN